MEDVGWSVVGVAILIAVVVASIISGRRRAAERTARVDRINELIEALAEKPTDSPARQEVTELLQGGPVGIDPRLTEVGGWFERVSPALSRLVFVPQLSGVVDRYFECFQFLPGKRAAVLAWFDNVLHQSCASASEVAILTGIASRLLAVTSAAEAKWLYDRVLDALQQKSSAAPLKTLALTVGRLAYAAGRPDRKPTIYDEQAIANDILARV